MIHQLHAAWRAQRVLLAGPADRCTLFMQALLDELGAKCARIAPGFDSETISRALTEGRIHAIIVPTMRALCAGDVVRQLETLQLLLFEAREAGVPLVILLSDDSVYRAENRPWYAQESDPIGGETPQGLIQSILDLYADGVSRGLDGDPVSTLCVRHLPCLGCGHPAVAPYSAWCRAIMEHDVLDIPHPGMQGVFVHPLDVCCGALLLGARFLLGDTACTGPFNLGAGADNLVPNRTAALRFTARHPGARPAKETHPAHDAALPLPDGAKARLLCGARCLVSGEEALSDLLALEIAGRSGLEAEMKAISDQTRDYLQRLYVQ